MTQRSRNWLIFVVAFGFLIGIRAASVHPVEPTPFFAPGEPELVVVVPEASAPQNLGTHAEFTLWVPVAADGNDRYVAADGQSPAAWLRELRTKLVFAIEGGGNFTELCADILGSGRADDVLVASDGRAAMVDFRRTCPEIATVSHPLELAWFIAYRSLGLMWMYQAHAEVLLTPPESFGIDLTGVAADAARVGMRVLYRDVAAEQLPGLAAAGAAGFLVSDPAAALNALNRADEPVKSP